MVAGIKEKVRVHKGDKEVVQRPVGESAMRRWDCSQIENEAEDESWRQGDQMEVHWDEEQRLEEILERRRMEGSPLQLEVMQKVPELVVQERMSQGEGSKREKESTRMVYRRDEGKTKCCCGGRHRRIEEIEKFKPERNGPTLEEFGGKNGGGSPGQDSGRRKQKRGTPWNGGGYAKTRKNKKVGRRLLGRNFSLFKEYNLQRLQCKQEESTEEEGMKQQQRMVFFERSYEENQIKRKNGRGKQMVGF